MITKEKCKDCGKCCLDTEMMLSNKDINIILRNYPQDLRQEEFVFQSNGYFQLKNINGHCVFFDISTKKCKIYSSRPQGCRFYPLIYDKDKGKCIYDEECPRRNLFYQMGNEFQEICNKLRNFLREQLNFDT